MNQSIFTFTHIKVLFSLLILMYQNIQMSTVFSRILYGLKPAVGSLFVFFLCKFELLLCSIYIVVTLD